MTSITKRYNQVARDYGRKSYRTDDDISYRDFMKKKTFFMFDASYKAPWSEFEKPYFEDSYEGMEQYLQNPPGVPWDWQDWPFDNPSLPPGAYDIPEGGGGWPSLTVFTCSISGCFCPGDTKTVTANCSHQIVGVHLASPTARISKEFGISAEIGGTTAQIEISASEDAGGACEIDIDMDANGIPGSHDSIMVSSCSECDPNCDDVTPVEMDTESTGETISDYSSKNIYALYGKAPYTWEISGSGVTVLYPVTQNPVTTIRANNACGVITVSVTDACNNEASCTLRGDGRWDRVFTSTSGNESVCGYCNTAGGAYECNGPHSMNDSNPWNPIPVVRFADWMCATTQYCCCMNKETGNPVGDACLGGNVTSYDVGITFCFQPCGAKSGFAAGHYHRTEVWKC